MFDVQKVRRDFPILNQPHPSQKPLIYLDSAASSQKPAAVIEAMNHYYQAQNANVHRGIHFLSDEATNVYEGARKKIADFIRSPAPEQIIFTRNATEALNLIAYTWARVNLNPGDEILTTAMEHHANVVPWQMAAEMTGATVRFLPITADGHLDLAQLDQYLTRNTKLFTFTAVSNVLGTINPVEKLVEKARAVGAITVIDAAQSVPHAPVDVQAINCDLLVFSVTRCSAPPGSAYFTASGKFWRVCRHLWEVAT